MLKKGVALLTAAMLALQLTASPVWAERTSGQLTENFNAIPLGSSLLEHGWSGEGDASVAEYTEGDGEHVARIYSPGGSNQPASATQTLLDMGGEASTVEVSFRMRLGDGQSYGTSFSIYNEFNQVIAHCAYGYANKGPAFADGNTAPSSFGASFLGLFPRESVSGNVDPAQVYPFSTWTNENTGWHYIKLVLNFSTQTITAYSRLNVPLEPGDAPVVENFPFLNTSAYVGAVTLQAPSGGNNQRLVYFDDISVKRGAEYVAPGTFEIDPSTAAYTVEGDTVNVTANINMPAPGAGQACVIAAAYDAHNTLLDVDISFIASQDKLVDGSIPYSAQLIGGQQAAAVKLYIWDSIATRNMVSPVVSCTLQP